MARSSNGESVLSRTVRIVEAFDADRHSLTVSEIARRSGLHIATASRLVEQLVGHGWLQREDDRSVRIGVRMWELASRGSPTLGLREAAMPFMEDLHAVVGHHTQLGVLEGTEVLFVERLAAREAVISMTRVAGRLPLHASSSGLVLLAHADAGTQERILAGPLVAYTDRTIVDPPALRAALAQVRRMGYALCPGLIHADATGLAVPVRGPGNEVIASLGVVVPNDGGAHLQIQALHAAARGISRQLTAGSNRPSH